MNKSTFLGTVCAAVMCGVSASAHAASISTYSFQSTATACGSEISSDCLQINANGLFGTLQVDLAMLDAAGNGSIAWNDFINFDATNSVSNWNTANLRGGGLLFSNWTVTDFGIDAYPDYSLGWNRNVDGGGELLLIAGFGISAGAPAVSNAASEPGEYCPSTGQFTNYDPGYVCPGGVVNVYTAGIEAYYAKPMVQTVPLPAAFWLFGSGLLAVLHTVRRNTA